LLFKGLGILSAVLISIALFPLGSEAWRWMLLSGVVPAAIALTLRTRMPETPRWYLSHGKKTEAREVMSKFFGYDVSEQQLESVVERVSFKELIFSPYARRVFFTSASWFLVDVGVYGIGILLPTFIESLFGKGHPPIDSAVTTGILYIFAGFGYLSAIFSIDVIGRKKIQTIGFFGMAIPLLVAAYLLNYATLSTFSLLSLFAVFYIMENFGPNTTTWVYPVELFPTRLRGTGHGIAATVGKIGALVATFFLPIVTSTVGPAEMLSIVAIASVLGGILTFAMGIETKKLSLDDVSEIFSSFYETFDKVSTNLLAAAQALDAQMRDAISKGGKINTHSLAQSIKLLEHNGDELVHDAFTKLARKVVAPFDRQDISSLLKALDDTLDFIDATVSRMDVYHMGSISREEARFSSIILEQAQEIRKAILSLRGIKASIVINASAIRIDELENEADALMRDSLGEMFEVEAHNGTSAFQMMKIKEIYKYFETTTDKAEDVADVLRNLSIKYSL
jgi:uncharacterized protein Yka (UPF0111/DUF47 family)